jgi:ABC-type sugar transport system permease subunit
MYSYNQAGYGQAVALLFLVSLFVISSAFTYLFRKKMTEA